MENPWLQNSRISATIPQRSLQILGAKPSRPKARKNIIHKSRRIRRPVDQQQRSLQKLEKRFLGPINRESKAYKIESTNTIKSYTPTSDYSEILTNTRGCNLVNHNTLNPIFHFLIKLLQLLDVFV